MPLQKLGFVGVVAVMAVTCDSYGPPSDPADPAWVGNYSLRADTVRYCIENQTPSGRTCDCTAPGHMEGTISLSADSERMPVGEVKLRECPPGAACGAELTRQVIRYQSFPPKTTSADSVHFCAGQCIGLSFNDGGIDFSNAVVEGSTLRGFFRRADGNVRACGADSGPFTATRQ